MGALFLFFLSTWQEDFWMRRLLCSLSVVAALLVAALAAGPAGAQGDGETPSIKKIMKTLHGGQKAPLNTLKTALKSNSPDWAKVQKEAKIFAELGPSLPKNDPPRGDKGSFEKLAKAYVANTKALEEAADKEDLKGARDALKKITTSCSACHKSHKGN
jgi:cytochrome c556